MNMQFWTTYLKDYNYFIIKAAILLIVLIICWCCTKDKGTLLAITLGYVLSDPFTYYFIIYHVK